MLMVIKPDEVGVGEADNLSGRHLDVFEKQGIGFTPWVLCSTSDSDR